MISNKDFSTMKTNVAEMVGNTSSNFKTRIGVWLNRRYRDIFDRYQWTETFGSYTLSTVAAQATYPLPADCDNIYYIFDNTNKKTLYQEKEVGFQNDTSLTGDPNYFSIKETSVYEQPSSSSVLSIVSDDNADTAQTIFVAGTSDGVLKEETVSLNGTTPATTTNAYTVVDKISKSSTTAGKVTVTANSGATTQATIAPNQLHTRYKTLHLYYIPNAVSSLVIRYKRDFLPLINDYDYPIVDVCDAMELGAEADAWRARRQFAKSGAMENQYEVAVSKRMFAQERDRDISIEVSPYERNADPASYQYDRDR